MGGCFGGRIAEQSPGRTLIDLTVTVPSGLTVLDSHAVEQQIRDALLRARREIKEVRIHVHPEHEPDPALSSNGIDAKKIEPGSGSEGRR